MVLGDASRRDRSAPPIVLQMEFGRLACSPADAHNHSMSDKREELSDGPHRIYFDSNDGDGEGRYGLWLNRSIEDLAKILGGPRRDMKVTIYQIGEIEMEAVLE